MAAKQTKARQIGMFFSNVLADGIALQLPFLPNASLWLTLYLLGLEGERRIRWIPPWKKKKKKQMFTTVMRQVQGAAVVQIAEACQVGLAVQSVAWVHICSEKGLSVAYSLPS